ncbi:MAG: cadherin repeat domain-containing protein [Nitrospirae bacterium]|nr:cadherin repeat domain-containing protein [Nitrospirota bacterium]
MCKNSRQSSSLCSLLLVLIMVSVLTSCGGGGGGGGSSSGGNPTPDPTPTPTNHSPVISCPANSVVNEGDVYNGDVNHTDSDAGDTATYSLLAGNPPLTINPTTGIVSGNTAGYGGQTILVTARVVDSGGLSDTCSFNVNVTRIIATHNVSGNIISFQGGCLDNIQVILTASNGITTYQDITDGSCNFSFIALPEDTYSVTIKDNRVPAIYETHKPGNLIVNQQKKDEGKLSGLITGLYPIAIRGYLNETIRSGMGYTLDHINLSHPYITKFLAKPIIEIYTTEMD